jgi:hypothetical protein
MQVPIVEPSYDGNGHTTEAQRQQDTRHSSLSNVLARSFIEKGGTFDRKQAASAWLEKREKDLAKPGALERLAAPDPTLAAVIDRYTDESIKKIGRTKAQVRPEEITRIVWEDLDVEGSRVLVRDMKNPGEKIGNDVWCDLPPEALQIILSMPKRFEEIFPYSGNTIGTNFTRACQFLEIIDLAPA